MYHVHGLNTSLKYCKFGMKKKSAALLDICFYELFYWRTLCNVIIISTSRICLLRCFQ